MLRSAILLIAVAVAATEAAAQDAGDGVDAASQDVIAGVAAAAPGAAAGTNTGIDFILRPTQGPEDETTTGSTTIGQGPIGPPLAGPTGDGPIGPALAGPTRAREQEAARRRPRSQMDPFAATGVQFGTFVIRPAIEIGVNATDNPAGAAEKTNAVGLIVAPEVNIKSEDTDYALEADLRGTAILYGEQEFDERDADARIKGHYDITSRTSVEAEAGYSYTLDTFTDPDTPAAAAERPPVHDFDASLGATQHFGRLALGLAGTMDREVHEDVPLSGGGTASRQELNNTEYGLKLRTSYEASGAMTPFTEAAAGRRDFDHPLDDSGFARSSVWGELRGGLIFDFGSKLSGQMSVGWRREDLEDDRLDDLDGPTAAAAILWSPRRLTEVRFDLSTEAQPTSIPDSAGSMLYSATLSVARQMTPRFRIEVGGGLDYEHFIGIDRNDTTPSAYAEASYAFNRTTSLVARYGYERTDSTDPDADTSANVFSVRLRLQR